MRLFLETPWIWLIGGAVVEVVLLVFYRAFVQSPEATPSERLRYVLLCVMGGVLLFTGGGVVLERLVVTPHEEVTAMLDEVCRAFETNDPEQVKRFVASSPSDILPRVDLYMGMVHFTDVRLRQLKIVVNRNTSPMTAKVRCFGVAWFRGQKELAIPYEQYAANFQLQLVRESDGWKVEEIEGDPQKPLDR